MARCARREGGSSSTKCPLITDCIRSSMASRFDPPDKVRSLALAAPASVGSEAFCAYTCADCPLGLTRAPEGVAGFSRPASLVGLMLVYGCLSVLRESTRDRSRLGLSAGMSGVACDFGLEMYNDCIPTRRSQ